MDIEQTRYETNKTLIELLSIPFSNTTFISQKEELMERIIEKAPENHVAPLLALNLTKIMLGKTMEAIELSGRIWEMGGKISPDLEALMVYQLNSLGLFTRSLVLLKPKISMYASARSEFPTFKSSILRCAVGLGDLDLLETIAKLEEFSSEKEMIETFVSHMDKRMLSQHFKTSQELMNKIAYGKQTGYEVSFDNTDGYPNLEIGVFIGGDSVDRYQLQNKLDDEYANYYIENKINPLDNFSFSVYDIKEHWPLEE